MDEPERLARQLLDALQNAMRDRDLELLRQLLDDEIALFGTIRAHLDRTGSLAYLEEVLAQPQTVEWEWTHVQPLVSQDDLMCFAVLGTVGFHGSAEPRTPFRLSCVAVRDFTGWRIRHFHGSVPQQD